MAHPNLPEPQGLYDGDHEHDACGVGFIANIKGKKSHDIVDQGLTILRNLTHCGAVGADPKASDRAGILIQIPDTFFREETQMGPVSYPQLLIAPIPIKDQMLKIIDLPHVRHTTMHSAVGSQFSSRQLKRRSRINHVLQRIIEGYKIEIGVGEWISLVE